MAAVAERKRMKPHPVVYPLITDAGGGTRVAVELGLRQTSVWLWTRKGMPRTEWTGETNYTDTVVKLANENPERSRDWTRKQVLADRGAS